MLNFSQEKLLKLATALNLVFNSDFKDLKPLKDYEAYEDQCRRDEELFSWLDKQHVNADVSSMQFMISSTRSGGEDERKTRRHKKNKLELHTLIDDERLHPTPKQYEFVVNLLNDEIWDAPFLNCIDDRLTMYQELEKRNGYRHKSNVYGQWMGAQCYEFIRKGETKKPKKENLIGLAAAFKLSPKEYRYFLLSYGYNPMNDTRDAVVIAFLHLCQNELEPDELMTRSSTEMVTLLNKYIADFAEKYKDFEGMETIIVKE